MTRKITATSAALAFILAGAATLRPRETDAARPESKPLAVTEGPECEGPLAVVAQFLTLAPEQVQALGQLLQEREQALGPIQQQIAAREQLIEQLIASGGDPAQIGQLVVEVHHLRQAAQAVQAQFLVSLRSVLTEPQRQRWAQAQMAAQLQPVVQAFQALRLF